jgi:asparagine N-glycosylation enzyme membrane subunit Stt3
MSTPIQGSTDKNAENEPVKEDSIFLDVADMSGYDKNLKTARIYLYIVAAIQIIVGIYQYVTLKEYDEQIALLSGAIAAGLGVVFIILAIWSYKMPSAAFLTALIIFIGAHVYTAIEDPSQIYRGIILKVLVIVALIKGFKDAKEYEQMKRTLGTSNRPVN